MKKRGYIGRLAALALVLCMVTMSLTAGTLAKYASDASGKASAVVARWDVDFKNGTEDYTSSTVITLKPDADKFVATKLVKDERIAPETTGSLELSVDGTNTEVAFDYAITLDLSTIEQTIGDSAANGLDTTAPLKFYKNVEYTQEADMIDGKPGVKGTIMADATGDDRKATATIYWKWDSSGINIDSTAAGDATDTKLGIEADTFKIPVTIKAEQKVAANP